MSKTYTLYHGKKSLKNELVERAKDHRAADRILHGHSYFTGFNGEAKGCAIGCLATPVSLTKQKRMFRWWTAAPARNRLRRDFGFPVALVDLAEVVFEADWDRAGDGWESSCDTLKSKNWPRRFAEAVPVGVKLSDKDVLAFCDRTRFLLPTEWAGTEVGRNRYDEAGTADQLADAVVRWLRSL